MRYAYECDFCGHTFEADYSIEYRDLPVTQPCPKCYELGVYRKPGIAGFQVKEGGCGNAANGYSSTHGDSENFKAGRKVYK